MAYGEYEYGCGGGYGYIICSSAPLPPPLEMLERGNRADGGKIGALAYAWPCPCPCEWLCPTAWGNVVRMGVFCGKLPQSHVYSSVSDV